ncbi:MAG: hypothetical protein SNJ59_07905 [Aggregatilineales bacterium]
MRLERRIAHLRVRSDRLMGLRLLTFFAAATLLLFAVGLGHALLWLLFAAAVAVFVGSVSQHRRIERASARHKALSQLVADQRARMNLDWAALRPALEIGVVPSHPYQIDLDITGERSLHHLLDVAVSAEGSERLCAWLLSPLTDTDALAKRTSIIQELIPRAIFRNRLIVNAALASCGGNARWRTRHLLDWAKPPERSLGQFALLLVVLAFVNALLFIGAALELLAPFWIVTFIVYIALIGSRYRETSALFAEALALGATLEGLRAGFGWLERYDYSRTEHLRAVCAPFVGDGQPSRLVRRAMWIVSAASLQRNVFLWGAVNAILPWDILVAHQLYRCRAALSQWLPVWLDRWWELEALNCLATFAYLNPEYTFPSFPIDLAAYFKAVQVGHPLIDQQVRVRNDFEMGCAGDIAIITGSNMSGKSTFLRTLGVNICLAQVGAPVCAEQLELTPFRLYACIRVTDSLADGFSYFYAEVRRLKGLLDALQERKAVPLFFVIDEIFRGTNNRERLIGSRSYIRALVSQHGLGVVSTHDLELVQLADELPGVRNYHFEDTVRDGRMVFDYVLRPGPSPTTNALKIMQLVGLPVGFAENSTPEERLSS